MSAIRTLSIVIPAYNEGKTIHLILDKVKAVQLINAIQKEVIIVNDCSKDDTEEAVKRYMTQNPDLNIQYFKHEVNRGKGGSIKTGIKVATGDVVIVQDADLEYDPEDYNLILPKFINEGYKVVYGSRILKQKQKNNKILFSGKHPDAYPLAYLGGVTVTKFANLLCGLQLTDEPTCYKAFDTKLIQSIEIDNDDFAWEPEITVKLAKLGYKFAEVPISYFPRKVTEGKKIGWKDGVKALFTILKYKFNFYQKR
jgi:glycosyltransferase involved in cell wall biosynthesis